MKRKLTLLAALLTLGFVIILPQAAFSQFFNAFQIDDSDYPYVKATYVAKDFVGDYFTNLTIDNFDVFENGVTYDETLDMSCIKVDKEQPISVVLLMETSASMNDVIEDGETHMQWVMEASNQFIDSLKFEAPGGFYIIQHAGTSMRQSNWMTDRESVNQFLINSAIQPGAVDFEPALNAAIEQLKNRPSNMRKVIVSIFDGPPSQNYTLDFLGMSAKCQKENIEVYGVNLVIDSEDEFYDFQTFSNLAGGNTKVIFSKKKTDLLNAMKNKAWQIQGYREVCQISWEATQPCHLNEQNRNVKVVFQNGNIKDSSLITYSAPRPPMLEFAENTIYFGADQAFREANVEVTAKNKNVTITGVEFSEEGMFSPEISTPYLVQVDVPFAFSVEYTEDPASAPHIVEMSFITEPCPTDEVIKLITNSSVQIEEEVDFGKVDIGEIAEMSFDCVLKNIMPVPISGVCELTGNGNSEMEIIDGGGNFTLEPDECLDVTVKYSRQTGGIIDVKLEYGLPLVFGNPMTVITMDTSLTSVKDLISSGSFYLADNYPNPAINSTSIEYFLPIPQRVYISVYNVFGELVSTLVNGVVQSGSNEVNLNVSDIPSGIYIYEMKTPYISLQKRMIINR